MAAVIDTTTEAFDTDGEHWRLIDHIYETGQSPQAWPVLLDSLFTCFGLQDEHRENGASSFRSSLHLLLPHFERALSLNQYIDKIDRDSAAETCSDLPYPLVVVGNDLNILYCNAADALFFPPQSGIRISHRQISITLPAVARQVSELLHESNDGTLGKSIIPLHREPDSNKSLIAISLPGMSGQRIVALAWLDPLDHGRLSAEQFQQLYHMTSAESRVLEFILRGVETKQIAEELSINHETVRTHLKSIYRKTETGRKTELIQAVMCGPAFLSRFSAPRQEMFSHTDAARERQCQTTTLSDGRSLSYAEFGAPQGTPILLVHNLIGSRLQLPINESNLLDQNIRLIIPDRPGVAFSDVPDQQSMSSWCQDIAELTHQLGLPRFHLIGSSLGAVYGLALAHTIPERIERFAMVSCLPETTDSGVSRELLPSTRRMFVLTRYAPSAVDFILRMIVRKGPEAFLDKLVCDLPEIDQQLYQDPAFHRMMVAAFTETVRQGTSALLNDIQVMARPWEFKAESITVPVQCWHGQNDTMAPHHLVSDFAASLKDCTVHLLEDETHWLLFRQWNTIVAKLIR